MDNFEIIINVAIIALLIPTIIFAYRLNRNLTALRENQNSLAKLIALGFGYDAEWLLSEDDE